MPPNSTFRQAPARRQPIIARQPSRHHGSLPVQSKPSSHDLGLFVDIRHRAAIDALPDVRYNDLGDDDVLLLDERMPTEPLESTNSKSQHMSVLKSHAHLSSVFARKDSLLDPQPCSRAAADDTNSPIQAVVAKHAQWQLISPEEATRVGEYIRPIQPDGLEEYLDLELTNLRAVRDSSSDSAYSRPTSPTSSTRADLTPLEFLVLDAYYLNQENLGLRTQLNSLVQSNRHLSTEKTCLELQCEHVAKELARVERQLRHIYAHLALEAHLPIDRVEKLCAALTREEVHLRKIADLQAKADETERRRKSCVGKLANEHLDRLQFERNVTKSLKMLNERLAVEQGARFHYDKLWNEYQQAGVVSLSITNEQVIDDSAAPTPRAALLNPFADLRRQVRLAISAASKAAPAGPSKTPPNSPTPAPLNPFAATSPHPGCALCNAGGACFAKRISDSFSYEEELAWFADINDDDDDDNRVPAIAEAQRDQSIEDMQASGATVASKSDDLLAAASQQASAQVEHFMNVVRENDESTPIEQAETIPVQATFARLPASTKCSPVLSKLSTLTSAAVLPAPITIASSDSRASAWTLRANTFEISARKMSIAMIGLQSQLHTHMTSAAPVAPQSWDLKNDASTPNAAESSDTFISDPSNACSPMSASQLELDSPSCDSAASKELTTRAARAEPQTQPVTYAMLRARFSEIRAKWREPLAALKTEALEMQLEWDLQTSQVATTGFENIREHARSGECEQQDVQSEPIPSESTPASVTALVQSTAAILIPQVPVTIGPSSVSRRLATLMAQAGKLATDSNDLTGSLDYKATCDPPPSEPVTANRKPIDSAATTATPAAFVTAVLTSTAPIPIPTTSSAPTVSHRLANLLAQSNKLSIASRDLLRQCQFDSPGVYRSFADAPPSPPEPVVAHADSDNHDTCTSVPRPEIQEDNVVFATGPHRFHVVNQLPVSYSSTFASTIPASHTIISVPMDTAQVSTDLAKAMFGIVSGIAQMARRIRNETSRRVQLEAEGSGQY